MRKIRHSFNMVEIVLAIGVVAFGITGVMALLPPALNANRDVAQDTFVDEALSKSLSALTNLPWSDVKGLEAATPPTENDDYSNSTNTDAANKLVEGCFIQRNNLLYFTTPDNIQTLHAIMWGEPITLNGSVSSHAQGTRIYMLYSWPTTTQKLKNRQQRLVIHDIYEHQCQ